MPLFGISTNVQESDAASRKRSHTDFLDGSLHTSSENPEQQKGLEMPVSTVNFQPDVAQLPVDAMNSPPGSCSPAALTDAGSSTPARDSPSPHHAPPKSPLAQIATQKSTLTPTEPAQLNQSKPTASPATGDKASQGKKRKLTQAEKDEAAAKKAKIAEEREAARKAKAEARAEKEAEKEAKKQKKQEEQLAAQRKQEKQRGLMDKFISKQGATTPSKKASGPGKDDGGSVVPEQTPESAYDQKFKKFYVKEGVSLAPPPFQMDNETKAAKSTILDEYVRGDRGEFDPRPFNPADTFQVAFPRQRGLVPNSVKKIMESVHGTDYDNKFGLSHSSTESKMEDLINKAQESLNAIPMKYLSFYEDVRPAYFGTATTFMPVKKLRQLSRRPSGKVLPLSYEYDSEAEWVEDDGEDLDDAEEDEEDVDGDEEMDDFLDDSEAITQARSGFEGGNQPVSTGIAYEDHKRLGPCATTYKFRLEFLLDSLEHHTLIDPFSTAYWPSKPGARNVGSALATASMPPPTTAASAASAAAGREQDIVPLDLMDAFKQTLVSEECRGYSKATATEVLSKKFTSCTKAQVRATLDAVAHRVALPGGKKSDKVWTLL